MSSIAPGDQYKITFSNVTVEMIGLSFNQQRELAKIEDEQFASVEEMFNRVAEKSLPLALPNHSKQQVKSLLEKLNLEMIKIIVSSAMGNLTEDEEKKFVSPLS